MKTVYLLSRTLFAVALILGVGIMTACQDPFGSNDQDSPGSNDGGGGSSASAAVPTFSPPAGTYQSDQSVEITTTTDGATIYYTLDGSNPGESSTEYTEAIEVAGDGTSVTIKAIAVKTGLNDSAVGEAQYTVDYSQNTGTKLTLSEWHEGDLAGADHEWFWFEAEPGTTYEVHTHDSYFSHPDSPGSATFDNELGAYYQDLTTSYTYSFPAGDSGQVDIYDSVTHLELDAAEDTVFVKATQWSGGAGSGSYWVKVVPVVETYELDITVTGNGYVERRVGGITNNGPYPAGTDVELTAVARDSDSFIGWSGDVSGSTNPVTVTVNEYTAVTAAFTGDTAQPAVVEVNFAPGETSRSVPLTDLTGKSVYLVKANYAPGAVSESTGVLSQRMRPGGGDSVSSYLDTRLQNKLTQAGISGRELENGNLRFVSDDGRYILDRQDVVEFNTRPLPGGVQRGGRRSTLPGLERSRSYTVGQTRSFWVDDGPNNQSGTFEEIQATLRAVGESSYIWVHDANYDDSSTSDNDNRLNTAQAEAMRDAFETLYPEVTNIFGYEIGGGPGGDGGLDSDERISVLFYDIQNDYSSTQSGGVLGYFWGKDAYTQDQLDSGGAGYLKSNEMEMFYIDAHFTDSWQDKIEGTLAHEYQHMIHFAQKAAQGLSSPTWFNEMLSMVAEDYLSQTLGTTVYDSHPSSRIWAYNDYYHLSGITDWLDGSLVYHSYASAYLFGGFLSRNYGGAELINQLSINDQVGISSVDDALDSLGYTETFSDVVAEYAKLHVYPTGHADIDYDYTGGAESFGAISYTLPTFDLFDIGDGPRVFTIGTDTVSEIRPYGFQVWSQGSWTNLSSNDLTVQLERPSNDSVQLYLMIK